MLVGSLQLPSLVHYSTLWGDAILLHDVHISICSPDRPPRTMPISPTSYLRDALQVPLIHIPDCTTHSVPHCTPPWCSSSVGGAVPPSKNLAIRLNPLLVAGVTLATMMVQALPVSATRTATTASIWPPYCLDILICFPQGHPGDSSKRKI